MKKTDVIARNEIRISKKAYNDFVGRLNHTLDDTLGMPGFASEAVRLFDSYVRGEDVDFDGVEILIKVAMMMIKPEIDKAIRRSASARERARLRRLKSTAGSNSVKESGETCVSQPHMNRSQRREYERELAREKRRESRRIMRVKNRRHAMTASSSPVLHIE
ncbi:MAG: hypothetical protein K2J65_11650 [Duncaniella sp.]|nr:hypothetical protein [Duncaniella sp.]